MFPVSINERKLAPSRTWTRGRQRGGNGGGEGVYMPPLFVGGDEKVGRQ